MQRCANCTSCEAEIGRLRRVLSDYERLHAQLDEHVRRLDVALNGGGGAKQASLIDLVSQFELNRQGPIMKTKFPDDIDTENRYGVSARGDKIALLAPPRGEMSKQDALTLAAWIVLVADPGGEQFERTLTAVANA